MNKQKLAYIYVLITALLWGSTAAVGKLLVSNLLPFQIIYFLFLFATATLFILILFQKKLKLIKKLKPRDYLEFALMGFLGVFLYHGFMYSSFANAPAQEAFLINYLWPFLIIIFASMILKEKLTWKNVFSVLISFFGVYIVATKGQVLSFSFTNLRGDLFALGAAVCYGLFSVLGKKSKHDKFVSMFFYYLFSLIFVSITIFFVSEIPILKLTDIIGLAWLGIFTNGIAFVLWFLALKIGKISKVANLIYLTPAISLVYIYFLTGEQILLSSIIGLVFILIGILIQLYQPKK